MKKLFALLLSMIMAVSLAVPAFAMETIFPAGFIGGADGPTEIITTSGLEDMDLDSTLEELLQQAIDAQKEAIDARKEAMGGVPGQIGLMVNGVYVQFPDAAPEVTAGRTMVPVRALMETLGGEAEMTGGKVICETDAVRLTFTPGGSEVLVEYPGGELPGDGQIFPLDCAPYIKGGRTYVPVRFIGEALGYEVGWDGRYQTAVLLDREALAAEIDENFSILNRVQASSNPALEEGKSWSVDVKGGLSLTLFDTLNGNQTYKADFTGRTLLNGEALDGSCSVTFPDSTVSALMKLMVGAGPFGDDTDENVKLIRSVLTGLKDMEVIMTREGLMWAHAPILDELGGQENAWFAADLGAELGALMFSETDTVTMGSVLAAVPGGDSVEDVAALGEMVGLMGRLYGDDKFTTANGVSTRTIGVDELTALYEDMGIPELDEVKDLWKEYNITMKVDGKGAATVTGVMETVAQLGVPAVRMTVDGAQNGQGTAVTMKVHVANWGELELTLTAGRNTTGELPRTEPPADAAIVETTASATNELAPAER